MFFEILFSPRRIRRGRAIGGAQLSTTDYEARIIPTRTICTTGKVSLEHTWLSPSTFWSELFGIWNLNLYRRYLIVCISECRNLKCGENERLEDNQIQTGAKIFHRDRITKDSPSLLFVNTRLHSISGHWGRDSSWDDEFEDCFAGQCTFGRLSAHQCFIKK